MHAVIKNQWLPAPSSRTFLHMCRKWDVGGAIQENKFRNINHSRTQICINQGSKPLFSVGWFSICGVRTQIHINPCDNAQCQGSSRTRLPLSVHWTRGGYTKALCVEGVNWPSSVALCNVRGSRLLWLPTDTTALCSNQNKHRAASRSFPPLSTPRPLDHVYTSPEMTPWGHHCQGHI